MLLVFISLQIKAQNVYMLRSYQYLEMNWNNITEHWDMDAAAQEGKMIVILDFQKDEVTLEGTNVTRFDIIQSTTGEAQDWLSLELKCFSGQSAVMTIIKADGTGNLQSMVTMRWTNYDKGYVYYITESQTIK